MNQSANTEEYNSKVEDSSVVLRINRLDSAGAEHLQNTTRFSKRHPSATVELSKLASKSEDSLDSGIYTRQKSHDSMDSLDSNESGFNGDNHSVLAQGGLSPMDEGIPSLPSQYEDYLRECQDIRQSIIVSSNEEEKQPVSRTDSGDEPDDDTEVEWLRMAGLSDLVVPTSGGSSTNAGNPSSSRISTDSLSSMTVLSTLTRPQREAVLRRITSFNRAQKIKKRPKPTISAIFPTIELEAPKSPAAVSPQYSPDRNSLSRKNEDALLKSTSLPRDALGFGDGGYPRRYSEITRPISKDLDNIDSPSRSAHLNPGRHKRHLASIVATESTGACTDQPEEQSLSGNMPGCVSPISMLDNAIGSDSYSLASKSLPDLNAHDPEVISSSSDKVHVRHDSSPFLAKASSKRSADRAKKALSDIPISTVIVTSPDSPAGLNLHAVNKFTEENTALSSSGNVFTIVLPPSSTGPAESDTISSLPSIPSRHSAPSSTLERSLSEMKSPASSPQRNRFRLSPHFSFSLRRRSPSASPLKVQRQRFAAETCQEIAIGKRDSRLSPLHKVAELSLSPSRTGSYQLHSSPQRRQNRRSIRRSRSLKSEDDRNISLVSVKSAQDGIETLRISSKGPDVDSWGSSKEEVGLQDPDESKEKAMSYTETADQANLPNFSLVKDRLGITKISDLSSVDMRKVQSLALIELTALFDLRGIDLKRRKSGKLKIKESGVFGIPLTTLVEWDQKRLSEPSLRVPLLLQDIVTFLQENAIEDEGILRKSGSSARIKALKQNVDLRYGYSNIAQDVVVPSGSQVWTDAHPNDVAALLKQFLRELPDPLLTTEYIEAFQSCGLIRERKEQLQALNLLIILLNEVHRDSLKVLLKFLERVVAAEQSNKMSLNNVAMITAPNLFMARKQSKKETISSTSQDLRHAAGTSNIVRMLIKYNKLLWTVPAFMLTQVRHMNRAEMSSKKPAHQKEKHKMKFFQGKAKDPSKKSNLSITHQPFDFETPKGVIRVQAPDMIMTSMAVQLDANITAGDIIARFKRQCERINPKIEIDDSTHALFEVGGNINERCLDPETNMSVLMRVNPEATLFIKPRI